MKILLFGGAGFIGSHLKEYLEENHTVKAITKEELDLTDYEKVRKYMKYKKDSFDLAIHSVGNDAYSLEYNLKVFFNVVRNFNKRIIYFGSGAELRQKIPADDYGLGKYLMHYGTFFMNNVFMLRLYAVFGMRELKKRFITHCILSLMENKKVIIEDDIAFGYLYIKDLCRMVEKFLDCDNGLKAYDLCPPKAIKLSKIAAMVGVDFEIKKDTLRTYNGDVSFFLNKFNFQFTPIKDAINEFREDYQRNRVLAEDKK